MKQLVRWMGIAAVWLAIWQLTYLAVGKEFIVPSFLHTWHCFQEMLVSPLFYQSAAATMMRVLTGMCLSLGLGVVFAVAAYGWKVLRGQLDGIATVMKATPVLAIVLYLILWVPADRVPVFVCFLMCYPAVYTNVLVGLDSMDKGYLELAKVYHLRYRDRLRAIYLPSVKPHLKAGISLIAGLSWKTVVAGEVLSIPKYSMGYQLMEAKLYFETGQLFSWMVAIILLSICFERLIKVGLRWL